LALLVVLALGVERLGDGGVSGSKQATAPIEPTTTAISVPVTEGGMTLTTTAPTVPTAAGGAPADDADPATADGADGAPDPGDSRPPVVSEDPVVVTPPPPAPTEGSLAASPSRVTPVHPNGQVVVSWSTVGATSVSVSGPGLASSATSGRQGVCPGVVVSSVCRAPAGTYTYRLTATGPGGTVERTASVLVA